MELLFKDNDIVVCIKPVGIDAEHALPEILRRELDGQIFPVHRLDKNVGGVMVYARTKQAAALLSRLIQQGQMVKEYVACVHGTPPPEGDWEDLLFKDRKRNKVFVVDRQRSGVRAARLEFRRLQENTRSTVHIRLHTGRSHQIRVQCASRGYPLVGDHKYGARDDVAAPMLYSCRITFPYRGQLRQFDSCPTWTQI